MIKTIIFDLGGVYFTDGTKQAIKVISAKYSLTSEKVKEVLKDKLGTQYRIGEITANTFWDKAKNYWGIEASSNDLAQIWLDGYKPIEGVVSIVKRLEENKYELLFLSDNVKERAEYLQEKYNFLPYFKDGVFSHIVKTRKPDPKIYSLVLEKASYPADNCIYIDNKFELLEPAIKLRMKGVQFVDPNQLEFDLKALGVKL